MTLWKTSCLLNTLVMAAVVWCASAAMADETLRRFETTQPSMGTKFHIVLYAPDEETANRAFASAMARIRTLDERLSDYEETSELSRLSAAAPTKAPIQVSDDLYRVLKESQRFAGESDGAFDISVGPLTKLWRRARRQKALPPADQLRNALAAVNYRFVTLDEKQKSVSLSQPNMRLDLGGIAKGFAADEALAELKRLGITRAIVAGSGDYAVGDPPPGESGWKIGVAPPGSGAPPARILLLSHCGVSTSGDSFQFVEIEGTRYSHIVDPKTGLGLTRSLVTTCVAPCATTSDALATAWNVMGKERALATADRLPEIAALVVEAKDGGVQVSESTRFKKLTQVKAD